MVREQIEKRGVKNSGVLKALRTVPRHLFVPDLYTNQAYSDRPLPIGLNQTISQPYIVAVMTERLILSENDRVLEIGTGSGYQTAILAEIARWVYTVEISEALAIQAREKLAGLGYTNISFFTGDGHSGWSTHQPYNAIIVTAAPQKTPQPLLDQLADDGRLIIPVGDDIQQLRIYVKSQSGLTQEELFPVRFVPLRKKDPN